ncbi:MAG: class I SAM-dependent methyltransferase [Solirubrobacteraceae bacterium]|jgi:SAM-dependent methyltransferase
MSPIHPAAAAGFQAAGADYERGRPGYPDAAIALLARELRIGPGRRIADLAAGTGKLTRAVLGLGAEVVAIEPVAGMRDQLRRAVPAVEVLEGTAERIPLAGATVDAVLVAQAFHWFDAVAAAAEIERVLAPGGGLGVIWNEWDRSVAWVDAMQQLVDAHAGDAPRQATSRWRERLEQTGRFLLRYERVVPNVVHGDLDTLLARVASTSFVAAMPDADRRRLLHQVRGVAAGAQQDGEGLAMPYRAHLVCYVPAR